MPLPGSLELTVERLATGGDGVGRAPDGRVTFIPFSAPGDRLRVRTTEARRRYLRASVIEMIAPGPSRVEPLCPVFGSCGGCSWQHLGYSAQLEAKSGILRDALTRIGKLASVPEQIEMRGSPLAYGCRSRARVVVEEGGVGFRRRRSRDVCVTAHCPVLVPALDAALEGLGRDPQASRGEWELAAGDDGEVSLLTPDGRPLGAKRTRIRLGDDTVAISAGVFSQANSALRVDLAGAVHEAAGEGELALELYAGAGFLTLGLARRFRRVVAIESHRRAVRDLRENLRAARIDSAEVRGEPVEDALGDAPLQDLRPEVVVLDPPRSGLPRGVAFGPATRRVVYLSCDPATLARDLASLEEQGFCLVRVTGFDLFPQTPHVEALAVAERP
jgi:tRNA/tmRNA/rRNA uracil-C5-methylase (TrmA/RlmC/RlmD family)